MISFQANVGQPLTQPPAQQPGQPGQPGQQQQQQQQQQQPQPPQQHPAMRLRDDPPPITRTSRKRKSPATDPQTIQHVLPPPHALMHPMSGPLPPGYPYGPPADYTPGGMPPPPPHQHSQSPPPGSASGRALSGSKRAEQNRKAQRAFRERRDQHVKALESRSQLLDAALASADEANRRWEECRALVDQLRVENAALRAALSQAQLLPQNPGSSVPHNGAHQEEGKNPDSSDELKTNSVDTALETK